MKKLLAILILAASCNAAELVLSTDTKSGGVTTVVTIGRIQADPAADGSVTLSVIPREIITIGATVISDKFTSEWITVRLSDALFAQINAEVLAAKQAADAANVAK
jgi:hypothetical protein